jgi:hypothetical protein
MFIVQASPQGTTTFSTTTLSILTLGLMTLSIKTLNVMTMLRHCDINVFEDTDICHNGTRHIDTWYQDTYNYYTKQKWLTK